MDEFELFKARASGCEITLQDFDMLRKESGNEENLFDRERRRSKRSSRHSSRRNSRSKLDQSNETYLDVTFEVQPPSPILYKKESGEKESNENAEINNQGLTRNYSQKESKASDREKERRASLRRSRNSIRSSNNHDTVNEVPSNVFSQSDVQYGQPTYHEDYNNDEQPMEQEAPSLQTPAIYRVRSFTTKKGEIISRGDSFKAYNRRNSNFLTVKNTPNFRRSSEAVPSLGSSLYVTSLHPGENCRRSSFTCLSQKNVECLGEGSQRKGSFGSRLAKSGSIKRGSVQSGSIKLLSAIDQVSNLSLEGSVLEETVEEVVGEDEEGCPVQEFQVMVMGGSGVGKSTLLNQLMTSEYLANRENNEQELEEERVISVMLDELESAIHFNEIPSQQLITFSPESLPDAYLLIFSVTEQTTFAFVKNCLNTIHQNDPRFRGCEFRQHKVIASKGCPFQRNRPSNKSRIATLEAHINHTDVPPVVKTELVKKDGAAMEEGQINYANGEVNSPARKIGDLNETGNRMEIETDKDESNIGEIDGGNSERRRPQIKPVILILANKQDLVRNRVVSEAEVKRLTSAMLCRHAEVSALLDLNVDEVLVDLVRWLRKHGSGQLSRRDSEEEECEDEQGCFQRAMSGLCGNIFK